MTLELRATSTRGPLRSSFDEQALRVGRLSSGLRIRSAADDASGLAISERMRSQVTGAAVATRNVHEAINLLATAEGGLAGITDLLHRARELAVSAADGGTGTDDQAATAAELRQIVGEIDRVARSSAYNGMRLLDGSRPAGFAFQVGAASGQVVSSVLGAMGAEALGLTGALATTEAGTVLHHVATSESFSRYEPAKTRTWDFSLDGVSVATVDIGRGSYTASQLAELLRAELGSDPPVSISVVAGDAPGTSRLEVVATAAAGGPTRAVSVAVGGPDKIRFATVSTEKQTDEVAVAIGSTLVDLALAADGAAISLVDDALARVLSARTGIGATQNRLQHRLGSLASQQDALGAARSRITDADMAREMTALVRAQVQGSAALALQAQQAPTARRVLRLLEGL